jgi:S-methyl-5-thioribose-1-phosphate isomerase/methylthioribulose-1-phosphate dehydratase
MTSSLQADTWARADADRSLRWQDGAIVAVDQRQLPAQHRWLRITTLDELLHAISTLAIRGAPAIGVAGALGVAQAVLRHSTADGLDERAVRSDAERIVAARPTAVNLERGVRHVLSRLSDGTAAVVDAAVSLLEEDERINRAAARRAAELIRELCPGRQLRLLTHCNTGGLATVGWGTALGAIRELSAAGLVTEVLAGETRPLLQGARLTAWELRAAGIPHRLCVDSAGPAAIAGGLVDCVVVGADRIAANGDVANKIGTYALAVAAARQGVPFVVVAPESTIDDSTPDGGTITIEERPAAEVTHIGGVPLAPEGTNAYNPAFDVTPAELITGIVTERRLLRPALTPDVTGMARALYARGWMDGTSGNVSARLADPGQFVITQSGCSKGAMTSADTVTVDSAAGRPVRPTSRRPSAETAVHAAIYTAFPDCGAIVHAHSPYATALSVMCQDMAWFSDYEIAKGLGAQDPSRVGIPVFENHADVGQIAADVGSYYRQPRSGGVPVLLIARHGATAWGPDLETARNRLECLELMCQLALIIRPKEHSNDVAAGDARRRSRSRAAADRGSGQARHRA